VNRHLKRRNLLDLVKMGGSLRLLDQLIGDSVYWVSGERRKGGMNLLQAIVWNSEKCLVDVKREAQEATLESKSIDATGLGGLGHSSVEDSVMELEQRTQIIQWLSRSQLERGRRP
jgi:hypothetical protein